ncbi:MAG TPA: PQQ-binding-like beta-propeller repeat protein [Verrucomicrobiota bacterium]|nr:quinonprotein alcohol dehydrogenase [Verrucomicrobiales bacterium]HRI16858.1 PQQ-binding-like beta-propeller repeat protein [Verrucomicrobiota bacterium]
MDHCRPGDSCGILASVNLNPFLCLAFSLWLSGLSLPQAADDLKWPEFRGPRGDGVSTSTGLPLHWSETNGVRWKTPIHGRAWSSPVIWNQQVWVSTATEEGHRLYAVAVDRESGTVIHDLQLFEVEKPQFAHKFNTYGSPTPAIEEGRVYVTFGSPGTACLDTKSGAKLWERRDFVCNHYRGAGSSPILVGDRLFMNFDGSDHQFVVALDKRTGKTLWETQRGIDYKDLGPDGKPESEGDWRKAFATCTMATFDGVSQLLSQGAKAMYSYDPATGAEIWRVEERTSHSAGTRPAVGFGMVFVPTGWSQGQVLAIKPGRKGEVIDANESTPADSQLRIEWRSKRNVPKKPALLFLGDLLYAVDDNGVATCWEAKTGHVVWNERVGGNYSASPIAGEGRIYLCSEEGKTIVVAAGRQFAKLAENQLEDGFMASPAVSGKALFLRTKSALYRIDK